MLNSQDQAMLDGLGDDRIPERGFGIKKEGWYSLNFEEITEETNTDDPENPYTEYNAKMRIKAGPSKGVEFLRLSLPSMENPEFWAKEYGPDGEEMEDADGKPVYALDEKGNHLPNGNWKRKAGIFKDVMIAVFVGGAVKGRKPEAKAKRNTMINEAVAKAGSIPQALQDQQIIVKFYVDRGFRIDQNTGEKIVYSEALQEKPRLKPRSFMTFTEANEKKYVLAEANMNPPKVAPPAAPAINLDL